MVCAALSLPRCLTSPAEEGGQDLAYLVLVKTIWILGTVVVAVELVPATLATDRKSVV